MGRCAAIKQRENIIAPAREAFSDDWDAQEAEEGRLLKAEKAIAVDGSGYYAAIRTAPDFGCVLWATTAPETVSVGIGPLADEPKHHAKGEAE